MLGVLILRFWACLCVCVCVNQRSSQSHTRARRSRPQHCHRGQQTLRRKKTPAWGAESAGVCACVYARRIGQPTQRATNYTARSNIDTAQFFSPRQRPTVKARHDQAALAASAEARGATHRARLRRASSTDSTRSTHFTLTQRYR